MGFFGVSGCCTGERGGLTLGLGTTVFEKKKKKTTCDLRELIEPVTWHVRGFIRPSAREDKLDKRRDSSFFYSRKIRDFSTFSQDFV